MSENRRPFFLSKVKYVHMIFLACNYDQSVFALCAGECLQSPQRKKKNRLSAVPFTSSQNPSHRSLYLLRHGKSQKRSGTTADYYPVKELLHHNTAFYACKADSVLAVDNRARHLSHLVLAPRRAISERLFAESDTALLYPPLLLIARVSVPDILQV